MAKPRDLRRPADRPQHPNYRLTTGERKRILLNQFYGVDLDPQAVEVAKLSLLLKVLEGENRETLDCQRTLPGLENNIKCGNSLIGPDFYADTQPALFDHEDRLRINAFDWQAEFSEVTKGGGFDAVIDNPPWRQNAVDDETTIREYVRPLSRNTAHTRLSRPGCRC